MDFTGDKVYYAAAERVSETYIDEFGNSATRLVRELDFLMMVNILLLLIHLQ